MNADTARKYILAHDERAKRLNRMGTTVLRSIHQTRLRERGMLSLYGGPVSKDELINAIADLEYPDAADARAIYYASVTP